MRYPEELHRDSSRASLTANPSAIGTDGTALWNWQPLLMIGGGGESKIQASHAFRNSLFHAASMLLAPVPGGIRGCVMIDH
ncbi:hypothetical protein DY000_02020779 [Brassica cretica]|uniref:Uncharacterized protein n=1 Tax=Brassica cretica TaxID=69181 RepID=A0ABQ7E1T5_BRACR|nr:hypothetical protein DY000_02020779 [Brassica cretica]